MIGSRHAAEGWAGDARRYYCAGFHWLLVSQCMRVVSVRSTSSSCLIPEFAPRTLADKQPVALGAALPEGHDERHGQQLSCSGASG